MPTILTDLLRRRSVLAALILFAFPLTFSFMFPAHAADFDIGCSTSELVSTINNANDNVQADTITLASGCTYTLTADLPQIISEITINGGGTAIIDGAGSFRPFMVTANGHLTLNALTLRNGAATGGGGIRSFGTVILNGSTVSGSTVTSSGGGIDNRGILTLNNSTVSGNTAATTGGGIENNGGTLTLNNSTVSGNTTTEFYGGGIWNSGIVMLNNSTVAGNSAGLNGGGLYNAGGGTMTLNNSIIADSVSGGDCVRVSGAVHARHSLIEDGLGCVLGTNVNNQTGDPALGALIGSPAYHPITESSIAVNAGSNALAVDGEGSPLTTDQTGSPRIAGLTVDMGAYEVSCVTFPYIVPASDTGRLVLAVECANASPTDDTISLTNSTYTLTGGQLLLANNGTLTLFGDGATISGGTSRVFEVAANAMVRLNQMTITGGSAGTGGGILSNGILTLNRSTIRNNTVTGAGGGIRADSGTVTLNNSTVTGNTAGFTGGGIAIVDSGTTLILNNSTVSGNTAISASGIQNNGATAILNNSIITNTCGSVGGTYTAYYSVSPSGLSGCGIANGVNGNVVGNPRLGALTGSPAYYPLLAGSVAIDAGSDALIPGSVMTDQPGSPRIQGASVDAGAYETTPASLDLTLTMQGRPGGESATKIITAHVQIREVGSATPLIALDFVSDTDGQITIPNLTTGSYDIRIKGTHTLAVVHTVALTAGTNSLTTDLLREGDANDDNVVQLVDFSLLASSFGTVTGNPGYNAQADFNNDGQVQLVDFSLLASNFGQTGAP